MRVDLYLSTFIFLVTMVTFSVAAAQILGQALFGHRRLSPVVRVTGQALCYILIVAAGLSVSGHQVLRQAGLAEGLGSSFRYLGTQDVIAVAPVEKNKSRSVTPAHPGTSEKPSLPSPDAVTLPALTPRQASLFRQFNREAFRQKFTGKKIQTHLKTRDLLCRDWMNRAVDAGFELEEITFGSPTNTPVLLCANLVREKSLSPSQLRELQERNLLIIGSLPCNTEAFPGLKGMPAHQKENTARTGIVTFSGERLTSLGVPAGLKLDLGQGWLTPEKKSCQYALGEGEISPEFQFFSDPQKTEQLSVMKQLASAKGGKILWTSLPARLHGKNRYFYGQFYDVLHGIIWHELTDFPYAGLNFLSRKSATPTLILLGASYEFSQLSDMLEITHTLKIPTTVYPTLSEAERDPFTLRSMKPGMDALGLTTPDHNPVHDLDAHALQGRIMRAQRGLRDFLPESQMASPEKWTPTGLLFSHGMQEAEVLTALSTTSVKTLVGAQFVDRLSPWPMTRLDLNSMQNHVRRQTLPQSDTTASSIWVIPGVQEDFHILEKSTARTSQEAMLLHYENLILQSQRNWAPLPLLFQSHVLGSRENISLLAAVLSRIQKNSTDIVPLETWLKEIKILENSQLLGAFDGKSALSWSLKPAQNHGKQPRLALRIYGVAQAEKRSSVNLRDSEKTETSHGLKFAVENQNLPVEIKWELKQ